MPSPSTSTSSSSGCPLPPALQCRMNDVLRCPENQYCADCSKANPRWASFLIPRVEVDRKLGVLVCKDCAYHHHNELGTKRCMIKFLDMTHEWTEEDTEILEYSGNEFVNSIFEAKLEENGFDKYAQFRYDEEEAASYHRAKFIKYKYKKRRFQDEVIYYKKMLELLLGKRGGQDSDQEQEEERSTSSLNTDKRRSYRRIRSIPQSGSSNSLTNLTQGGGQQSLNRCASSPDMTGTQVEVVAPPPRAGLRRKSTKSVPLHSVGRGRAGRSSGSGRNLSPCRSPSRRNLGLVESPKIDMRNRRLSAMACNPLNLTLEDLILPVGVTDGDRRQSFSYAA